MTKGLKPPVILLAYGEGGHNAQMMRLLKAVNYEALTAKAAIVTFNDGEGCTLPKGAHQNLIPPLRDKQHGLQLAAALKVTIGILKRLCAVLKRYRPVSLLSTGPGVSILPALFVRVLGGNVVHLETWSRFNTASLNGRVMYWLATHFYVQNEEQLQFYPKAIWCGRL